MNIAIVVSEFNNKVTSRMHQIALEKAKKYAKENAIPFIDGKKLYEFSKVR